MLEPNPKRILVVSGDYEITQQVRQSLSSSSVALQTAYSHSDGLYTLENGEFDAVFVDALMLDWRTGQSTFLTLANSKQNVPVIALAAARKVHANQEFPTNVIVSPSSESGILRSLSVALQPPNGNVPLSERYEQAKPTNDSLWPDEVQTLFDLSKSLSEVLELSEVLNRVVEAARSLTDAEEGMILLPDDEHGDLYLRAKVGIDVEVARNFRIKTEDTLAGRVFGTGQPVLIGAQGPQKVKTEYLVNALLYVPIIYEGKCIGVLGVNNKSSEHTFNERHQDLLKNLASFAAIAIENAGIHEEALQRTKELQVLVEASRVVNSSVSMDKTLPNICEQLMRVVNVNLSEILKWDRETNQLRTLARSFRTIWSAGYGPGISPTNRPSVKQSLEQNRPVGLLRTSNTIATVEAEYLDQIGVQAVQIIPITGGDQPLGAVQLFYIQPPSKLPDPEVLQRIQHMALEVVLALSNQSTQARGQTVFRPVEEIIRLTHADWCELALLKPDKSALNVTLVLGKGVWLEAPQPSLDLGRYPDLVEAIESQAPITKQSDSKIMTAGMRTLLDTTGNRSILVLPLIQRGQTQGVVLFGDARRGRIFSERDIDMGRAIVGQAATALENAELVHDLERSFADLKDAQGRLVQTARLSAMGELAAAVAHQINNPLTTIMVDSEMMLMDEPPNSRNYRSLQAINRAGKRSAGVARRLLAIARPNDPQSPPERIDVADTIEGVVSLVKAHIERDRIQLNTQLPQQPLPSVWAVPGQLDDIWLNLLLNAHDALIGREGAQMGIRAAYQPTDEHIEVEVWDNGPGIPAKIIDEIFKPFFTTKPVGEGTGLGLHICRQTAERVGGSISVKSKPEEGTQFLVRLPVKRGGMEL